MDKVRKIFLGILYAILVVLPCILLIVIKHVFLVGGVALAFFAYLGWFIFIRANHDDEL
ncbi:hypothetical protein KG087_04640 [Lacticaseibacillus zeae]|uniref:hypothetical protein n=1 Tax=Lacticaseibacillus zeae TaxID=57037 RepID=UPI000AA378A3|nr:hypothetical protein [Lacticaseibacillus zeae]QVI32878.1 hypothetical protein KG087_04640 [Lacticaseibacillus zeae]